MLGIKNAAGRMKSMAFIANERQQLSLNDDTHFLTQRLEIRIWKKTM